MDTIEDFIKSISDSIQKEYDEKYSVLGTGRNRKVYDMGNGLVVKVPLNAPGMEDNLAESEIYKSTRDDPEGYLIRYAECNHFNYKDIPLVIMEKVEPIKGYHPELPDWTDYVDCAQVGYNKEGKLVAYDYGRF